MSHLVAIAYPNRETAEQVRRTLAEMQKEHIIELDDLIVVTRSGEGKVKLHQPASVASAGTATGAVWGGLIGLVFLAPAFGMALGAAAGGTADAIGDLGVDDRFMKDLGASLERGDAAVIVLLSQSAPDNVIPRVREYGGHALRTSLSQEAEDSLRAAVA